MTVALPPLTGELLTGADGVRVIVRPSVLREAREEAAAPAGLSVAEIVEAYGDGISARARVRVAINGEPVPRDWWGRIRVKPGAVVTVVGVPAGGGNIFKTVLAAVVAVAAAVVAPFLAAPIIGALGFAAGGIGAALVTGIIGAGISIAGALAINALFPAAKPSFDRLSPGVADSLERSPSYSIGGARNENRPYGPIPVVLGRHRQSPPYGAQPFTEIFGDDQYLRMVFVWGYGPISVSDLRIGETPIDNFEGVEVETVQEFTDGGLGLYPLVTFEEQLGITLTPVQDFSVRRTAEQIDEFTVDVSFPQGVFRFQRSNGRRVAYTVEVRVEYSVAGADSWTHAGDIVVTSSSPDTMRRALRVEVPRGQYDVRVAKWSADYTGDDTVGETVTWTAIKSRRDEVPIKADQPLTVTAIRIKASEELSGVIETLNAVCRGLVKAWNGTAWVDDQPSSNPADLFRHVLQGSPNARPVPDASIDLENLQDWHAYCVAQGFTFNQVRDFSASVFETLRDIAAAGRAAVSLRDGKWGVVWDAGATDIVQHFTPRNSSNFQASRAYADMPHAWRVRFLNEQQGWLQDERIVYDDGYDETNASKFEGIDFAGVTHPDLIWRHGRYHIAQLRLRRETYELDTDFEHLVATRGDRVRVQHDVPIWGLSAGRVRAVDGQDVTLDEPLTMEAGTTYTLRFRLADGDTLERNVVGVAGTFATVTLDSSGAVPEPGDLFMAGEIGQESVVLRVLAVTPRQDLGARLILVDDAPEIANADTGTIPPFDTQIANQVDFRTLTVAPVSAIETLVEEFGVVRSRVRVTWAAPQRGTVASYLVQHRLSGTSEWQSAPSVSGSSAPRIDLFDMPQGSNDIRVKALFTNGASTGWAPTTILIDAAFDTPANVAGFRIAVVGDDATLKWRAVENPIVAGYDIRFSPVFEDVSWSSAVPLQSLGRVTETTTPVQKGTYLIRARTFAGVRSEDPAIVINRVGSQTNFNVVELIREDPEWAGVGGDVFELDDWFENDNFFFQRETGVYVDGERRLRLGTAADVFDRDDWFEPGDFFFQDAGTLTSGFYEFAQTIDLGQVYTSQVSVFLDAFGVRILEDVFARPDWFAVDDFFGVDPAAWSAIVDISTSDQAAATADDWSPYEELSVGNVTARSMRFRLRLASFVSDTTPVVRGLSVEVDMPDRVIAGEDITVPVEGLSISFAPPFRKLQGVGIAAQELATGDYVEMPTNQKSEAGFFIRFRDAGGNPVARVLDYVAKGYGVETP